MMHLAYDYNFSYNPKVSRYVFCDNQNGSIRHILHCGYCFQIQHAGEWHDVRIELNHSGWYLVGFAACSLSDLEGCPCRHKPINT